MSAWLVAFVGLIYLWIAIEQFFIVHNPFMGIVFLGYSLSNVGFYFMAGKP